MPNRRRFHLPGIPLHIVQRGNNRSACFHDRQDREGFLLRLAAAARKHEVEVHAYVLMSNHFHLLATPAGANGASRMVQAIGATYVRDFNLRHGRTGTLWEGRFFACPVDAGTYFWRCHRYIESNPVRAGIVANAGDFAWSSHARNAFGAKDHVVTPHPAYIALGPTDAVRATSYRGMFDQVQPDQDLEEIRLRLRQERALGSEEFHDLVRAGSSRSPTPGRAGRPPKPSGQITVL